jgi:O-antigen/teichoic acid export membrane protein
MADNQTGLASAFGWSGVSALAREVSRAAFTVLLARLIGPEDFGVAAQAMVYIFIVGLLVDPGFSSALIQRKNVEPEMPGVVASGNLAAGTVLTLITIAIAPLWAGFMHTPELMQVLIALAPTLLIASAIVTPRAMLIRNMQFRTIAIADTFGVVGGGVLGLVSAIIWSNYWAVVVQIVGTNALTLIILIVLRATYRPNLKLGYLREIAAFSWRAFLAGLLLTSVARNIDNLLIGRFQGPQALAFYSLAYRLLLLPVQFAGNSVSAVLFPAFSRLVHDVPAMAAEMARATRTLAALSFPAMALISAAAPQLISLIFGPEWAPAVPIVQVLGIVGAIQTTYVPTDPFLLGTGRAKLNLRYAWISAIVTILGILAGLPFGPFGVAAGYAAATVLLLPVEWLIRRQILGMGIGQQIRSLLPGCHTALWVVVAYMAVAAMLADNDLVALLAGGSAGLLVGVVVMRLAHRELFAELANMCARIVGRGRRAG